MELNNLMTSEFEGYTPNELKAFLLQFKYEYRRSHNENLQLDRQIKMKEDDNVELLEKYTNLQKRNTYLEKYVRETFDRKLTFEERLSGQVKKQ